MALIIYRGGREFIFLISLLARIRVCVPFRRIIVIPILVWAGFLMALHIGSIAFCVAFDICVFCKNRPGE